MGEAQLRMIKDRSSAHSAEATALLAREFGVSESTMESFVGKFSPALTAPNQYSDPNDIMLFVHIPKTGGISVGKSLQDAYDIFYDVAWNDVDRAFADALQRAQTARSVGHLRQVIMGHFGWAQIRNAPLVDARLKLGTMFREPVARLISNYKYNLSPKHPDRAGFQDRFPSIESYIDHVPCDTQLRQAIGGTQDFTETLNRLTRHYTFLGVTHRLQSSLSHLARSHGLRPMQAYTENVGAERKIDLSPGLVSEIRKKTVGDRKIHDLLSLLYGGTDSGQMLQEV